MSRWVIHKTSRSPDETHGSYFGSIYWNQANIVDRYSSFYENYDEAKYLVEELNKVNPVRFTLTDIDSKEYLKTKYETVKEESLAKSKVINELQQKLNDSLYRERGLKIKYNTVKERLNLKSIQENDHA